MDRRQALRRQGARGRARQHRRPRARENRRPCTQRGSCFWRLLGPGPRATELRLGVGVLETMYLCKASFLRYPPTTWSLSGVGLRGGECGCGALAPEIGWRNGTMWQGSRLLGSKEGTEEWLLDGVRACVCVCAKGRGCARAPDGACGGQLGSQREWKTGDDR